MNFKRRKLTMLQGTMTKQEAKKISEIDSNDLIIGFGQPKAAIGSEYVHVICYENDAKDIYKLFNKIRAY